MPALPSFKLHKFVSEKIVQRGFEYRTGVVYTTNRRLWEHDQEFLGRLRALTAIAIDMETATIFIVGHHNSISRGALLLVSDVPITPEGVKTEASDREVTQEWADRHLELGIDAMSDTPSTASRSSTSRSERPPVYPPRHMTTTDDLQRLLRHTDQVVPPDELAAKLELGRPLRVKLGLDPTAPEVTLGWAVVLRKLRHFQELGHTAVLIVGDFTAQVGDPSERAETRRRLSEDQVNIYAENLLGQFEKVLLAEPLEIRRNSEWLATMGMPEVLELTSAATVAQMMERADFAKRYEEGTPISVMEFLYPLLQGYDSVAVEADVELGGSDQLWNLMMGRSVQERYGMTPQVAVTMPILVGVDGTRRMGQSLGNYIGVEDDPTDMFGKTMSIPDDVMPQWFRLAADLDDESVDAIVASMESGDLHPNEAKRQLARTIVSLYWGESAAATAEEEFDKVFKEGGVPEEIDELTLPAGSVIQLPALIREAFGMSGSEARRMIDQGAVRVDGKAVEGTEIARDILAGTVLRVGRRRFVRLVG